MSSDGSPAPLTIRQPPPAIFPIAAAVYLAVALAVFVLVDAVGVGGSREWVIERIHGTGALWLHIWSSHGPTEMFQWALLAYLVVIAAVMGGHLGRSAPRPSAGAFWTLVAVGAVMMVLVDAGDVRHNIRDATVRLGLAEELETGRSSLTVFVDGMVYAVIGGVFAWAILLHGKAVRDHPRFLRYGLAGVGFYGLAFGLQMSKVVVDWYPAAGAFLEERVLRTSLHVPVGFTPERVHNFLMDFVVEESLELLGIAFLVAAAVAYFHDGIVGHSDIQTRLSPPNPWIERPADEDRTDRRPPAVVA